VSGEVEPPKRKPVAATLLPSAPEAREAVAEPSKKPASPPPFLLDFFPLEDETQTRLAPFYRNLREGQLTTTRCRSDGTLSWPPRVVCPKCHTSELDWVDLPSEARIYAFSAVLVGAPLGMESEVPFVVGMVEMDGIPFRMFGRIVGKPCDQCRVGERVRPEPYDLPDGRVFYRFRTVG
jgi:uncharacterized OB-fold protein